VQVDESMLTGESLPQHKNAGDKLMCATIVTEGFCTIRVTSVGADTALAQIVSLVAAAQMSKPPIQVCAVQCDIGMFSTTMSTGIC
jgi:cation transport ATPase